MKSKNIGIVDVDGFNTKAKFPNLALMKISAYHKQNNDNVEFYNPDNKYNTIYKSKIFTFSKDVDIKHDNIIQGGTGYDLTTKLPENIDNMFPDYSLYNITDTAYGYLTRGCPRGCEFCIVCAKEGKQTKQMYKLNQFWNGQKEIKLLDPNITAAPNFIDLINELAETKAYIDFTQGIDLRLLTEKKIEAINKLKIKMVHFAWDNIKDEKIICEKLKLYVDNSKYNNYRKIVVYVLVNFNSTFEEDLYRVYKIRELGASPYVMIYDKKNAEKKYKILSKFTNFFPYSNNPKNRKDKIEDFEDWKKYLKDNK